MSLLWSKLNECNRDFSTVLDRANLNKLVRHHLEQFHNGQVKESSLIRRPPPL